ncbi:MAG: oxygen-independent coproporphyrinogen-3 oxidase, partial [Myxococcota bacterium]
MSASPSASGGVYVHFPYCAHRCVYCDFTLTTPKTIPHERYTDALLAELELRRATLHGPARSLYIGGGTPSLWALDALGRFIAATRDRIGLTDDAEVTVEANPNQVTQAWLGGMRRLGVNRLSVGVQALRDPLLQAISRRHTVEQALACVAQVTAGGFRSFSVDLMFGLPGQTLAGWRDDLARMAELEPPHLSVYNLTVEPGTVLAKQVAAGLVTIPSEEVQTEMLFAAETVLTEAGWEHYEVSSYARPGHRAVHNAGYWDGSPYMALGAGAHGFDGAHRYHNDTRVKRYVETALGGGDPTAESEWVTPDNRDFERVMTGLRRLTDGVDLA